MSVALQHFFAFKRQLVSPSRGVAFGGVAVFAGFPSCAPALPCRGIDGAPADNVPRTNMSGGVALLLENPSLAP
jgi:hypothetical protein